MNSDTIFGKTKNIEYSEFENETVILNSVTGEFLKVNDTGKNIFKLVNGKNTLNNIYNQISLLYNINKSIIIVDVDNFLNDLLENNIIRKN